MEGITISALIGKMKEVVNEHPDTRRGNNLVYRLIDAVLGAFSVFFIQSPSFLAHQQELEEMVGRNNAKSLFGIVTIPTPNQIRNILDLLPIRVLFPMFRFCFELLHDTGILDSFRMQGGGSLMGNLVVALDGTGYFSSHTIHCKNCTVKIRDKGTNKEKTSYEHSVITPVIVSPSTTDVIPLEPEYIIPQDGDEKQDCENKAAKRWLAQHGDYYRSYEITYVGDDLYARQPVCLDILKRGHFILVCKPESHPYLYSWVNEMPVGTQEQQAANTEGYRYTTTIRKWDEKLHKHTIATYQYANHVPIRDTNDALHVNFVEVTITDEKTGKQIYHNAFITDHQITEESIEEIVIAGRARWKIENGNNNTLKTKGYHFEHNYGHGKENLSQVLTTLIIIAFLFHTILHLVQGPYQRLRDTNTRARFFQHIQTLTIFLIFDNWDHLFRFMEQGRKQRFNASDLYFGARAPG